MAYQFGANPIEFNLSRDEIKAENVEDQVFHIGLDEKPKYLLSILKKIKPRQTIVFSNFKNQVGRIVHFLNENDHQAVGISSLLPQNQRNRVIEHFKTASHQSILVATDLAARGLDIKGVDLVINFELPEDPENYIHRMGRTGRAGRSGQAVNLASDRDVEALMKIETYLKGKVKVGWLEDEEILQDFKSFPEAIKLLPTFADASKDEEGDTKKKRERKPSQGRQRTSTSSRTERSASPTRPVHRDRLLGRHKQRIEVKKRPYASSSTTTTTRKTKTVKRKGTRVIRRSSRKKTFLQKVLSFFSRS